MDMIERILERWCNPDTVEHIIGDLREIGDDLRARHTAPVARFLLALETIRFLRPAFRDRTSMGFKAPRTLQTAVRSLRARTGLSILNLAGLTVGVAACMAVALWVQSERAVDTGHPHAHQTYRLVVDTPGQPSSAVTSAAFAPAFQENLTSVTAWTRVFKHWENPHVQVAESGRVEDHFYFADSTFFDLFGYAFIAGDADRALQAPYSVVITRQTAKRLFGDADPMGQRIAYNSQAEFTVTGVVETPSDGSHLRPDFLASMGTLPQVSYSGILDEWRVFASYVVIQPGASVTDVAREATNWLHRNGIDPLSTVRMQPLTDIHLRSALTNELEPNGDIRFVHLMMILGSLILVIACINYINITTAQAFRRQREIGVRKSLGAIRSQLVLQFTGEAMILSLMAIVAGTGIVMVASHASGSLLNIPPVTVSDLPLLGVLATGLWILTTLGAGLYPAFLLSGFQPSRALKGVDVGTGHGQRGRNALVILQFTACLVLLMGTWSVRHQLNHVRQADLGFSSDAVLAVPIQDADLRSRFGALRERWAGIPGIKAVGGSSSTVPGQPHSGSHRLSTPGQDDTQSLTVQRNWIDASYVDALSIDLIAGDAFVPDSPANFGSIVLNETAARQLGWSDPAQAVGEQVHLNDEVLDVSGVVRDYHYESLHHAIGPLVLTYNTFSTRAVVHIQSNDLSRTLAELQEGWSQYTTQSFSPVFLDDALEALYEADRNQGRMMGLASLLAVLVACLGLVGLTLFVTEQRTRELGIRKVHGATTGQLVTLLSGTFLKLVLVAIVVAVPIAWMASATWKQAFAYPAAESIMTFAIPCLLALLLAGVTIAYHTVRAARKSPVECLKA